MKKILSILIFLAISQTSFASSLDYKGLKKLSKNNTFMDGEGKPFSDDKITNKKNTLLIIYNHGSGPDVKTDPCKANPKFGYIWEGAVVPAILQLHNKKINELEIKIYRLCSGVKGISSKEEKKIRKSIKKGEKLDLLPELKQLKRQNIILAKADEFIEQGFENIVLAGYSAGGWASLSLQSRFPEKFKGAIAMNPAFAGPKKEWQKKYPEWGAFREHLVNIFNQSDYLNALLFAHANDVFEDPETLSFFKKFKGLQFIDYSEVKPKTCTWADVDKKMPSHKGHNLPQSSCFTKFVDKNNYFINYLESIF